MVIVDPKAPETRLRVVAEALETAGFQIVKVWGVDDLDQEDAGLDLASGHHVQLGDGYAMLYGPAPAGAILGPLVEQIESSVPSAVVRMVRGVTKGGRR